MTVLVGPIVLKKSVYFWGCLNRANFGERVMHLTLRKADNLLKSHSRARTFFCNSFFNTIDPEQPVELPAKNGTVLF